MCPVNPASYFEDKADISVYAGLITEGSVNAAMIPNFIEDDYYGIYVTHIQELARETEQIASLVAGIADDGKTRTYKIERKPAEGVGHASTLVDKYRLNYEEIKERLNR